MACQVMKSSFTFLTNEHIFFTTYLFGLSADPYEASTNSHCWGGPRVHIHSLVVERK